ncbi:MAG: exodeoxyribonuclease V subunit beta [Desulfuromonadaceae bacterium]|nr:exodeoxyribonuclease V subunit beta [Desulfuromonadaceae bacterium]
MTSPLERLPAPLKGFHLIEASAGTGKTRTITDLFVRLLLEGHGVGEILVVTFTEAATKELKSRLRRRLLEALAVVDGLHGDPELERLVQAAAGNRRGLRARLQGAVTGFDEAAVFTIHGFCRKILQEHCFESGQLFDVELIADPSFLLQEAVEDFWRRLLPEVSPLFLRFLLKLLQDRRRDRDAPDLLADFARQVLSRPDLRVLSPPAPDGLTETEQEVAGLFAAMRILWEREREKIFSLLQDQGLNRRSYPVNRISPWMSEGDDFFLSADPFFEWKHLDRFSVETLAAACKKGFSPVHHPFFEDCRLFLQKRDRLKEDYSLRLARLKNDLIHFLDKEMARRKETLRIRSFDDLLHDLRNALTSSGGTLAAAVRSKFPVALIDEFQDTDPVQYQIFRSIYASPDTLLFIIGDPKQAIYSFRGADIFTYMAAGKDAAKIALEVNWRSAPQLVRGVNTLFARCPNPFLFDAIRFREVAAADKEEREILHLSGVLPSAPLRLCFFPRMTEEREIGRERADEIVPRSVAAEISSLLQRGRRGEARLLQVAKGKDGEEQTLSERPLEAGDIAVIVRTNLETRLVRDALLGQGIPSVIHGSESLFASVEAEDVLRLLQALAEPGRESLIKAALATPFFGFTPARFHELIEDEKGWGEWLEKFTEWHRLWLDFGLITMATALMNREGVRERLIRLPQGERRLTNLVHCWEILHRTAEERHLGMKGVITWFARQVAERPEQEEYQLRLETDDRAVQVITIHRSKGLEFPVVFAPYCWSGGGSGNLVFFHDQKQENRLTLDLGSAELAAHKTAMAAEELAENMRLLYVALTRAKHLCHLAWGAFKGGERSAVAYLFHGQDESRQEPFALDFSRLSDDDLREDLNRAIGGPETGIVVTVPPAAEECARRPLISGEECPPLELPVPPRTIPRPWRMSSFSSLISGSRRDEGVPEIESLEDFFPTQEPSLRPEKPLTLFDFPRGIRPGLCLHHILERVKFQGARQEERRPVIVDGLRRYGLDEELWLGPVAGMVEKLLAAPLSPGAENFSLNNIENGSRIAEMGFYFPLQGLTNDDLIGALSNSSSCSAAFLQRLKKLPEESRGGFMKGFIDLVFEHQGRYYIIDWKSNYLGRRLEDYRPHRLEEVMDRELYLLQYHLYALALHKHLRFRLRDYHYERHFGAVFYIFLRGIGGPEGCGIYRDRPSVQTIEALESCFQWGPQGGTG